MISKYKIVTVIIVFAVMLISNNSYSQRFSYYCINSDSGGLYGEPVYVTNDANEIIMSFDYTVKVDEQFLSDKIIFKVGNKTLNAEKLSTKVKNNSRVIKTYSFVYKIFLNNIIIKPEFYLTLELNSSSDIKYILMRSIEDYNKISGGEIEINKSSIVSLYPIVVEGQEDKITMENIIRMPNSKKRVDEIYWQKKDSINGNWKFIDGEHGLSLVNTIDKTKPYIYRRILICNREAYFSNEVSFMAPPKEIKQKSPSRPQTVDGWQYSKNKKKSIDDWLLHKGVKVLKYYKNETR